MQALFVVLTCAVNPGLLVLNHSDLRKYGFLSHSSHAKLAGLQKRISAAKANALLFGEGSQGTKVSHCDGDEKGVKETGFPSSWIVACGSLVGLGRNQGVLSLSLSVPPLQPREKATANSH